MGYNRDIMEIESRGDVDTMKNAWPQNHQKDRIRSYYCSSQQWR